MSSMMANLVKVSTGYLFNANQKNYGTRCRICTSQKHFLIWLHFKKLICRYMSSNSNSNKIDSSPVLQAP
ncbi:hypothetical protein AHAS_Ahas07G0047900 [Arachis hypogaea]